MKTSNGRNLFSSISSVSFEIAVVLLFSSSDGVDLHAKVRIDWSLCELLLESLLLSLLLGHENSSVSLELQLLQIFRELLWALDSGSLLSVLRENLLPAEVDWALIPRGSRNEHIVQLNISELFSVPLLLIIWDRLHVQGHLEITTLIEL